MAREYAHTKEDRQMELFKNIVCIAAGIALIKVVADKLRDLNDDYRYTHQDLQRYTDVR